MGSHLLHINVKLCDIDIMKNVQIVGYALFFCCLRFSLCHLNELQESM